MGLFVRSDRARDLARRLAERRGCTMTEVIVGALEREAADEEARRQEKIRRTLAIAEHFRSLPELRPGLTDKDLYDDEGNPIL